MSKFCKGDIDTARAVWSDLVSKDYRIINRWNLQTNYDLENGGNDDIEDEFCETMTIKFKNLLDEVRLCYDNLKW